MSGLGYKVNQRLLYNRVQLVEDVVALAGSEILEEGVACLRALIDWDLLAIEVIVREYLVCKRHISLP